MNRVRGVWWLIAAAALVVGLRAEEAKAWNPNWMKALGRVRDIQRAAVNYRQEFGVYPIDDARGSWFDKLVETKQIDDDRDRSIQGPVAACPMDVWGNPILYIPARDFAGDAGDRSTWPTVRSVGADGVDDGGESDDIDASRGINDGYYNRANRPAMWVLLRWLTGGLVIWGVLLAVKPRTMARTLWLLPGYGALAMVVYGTMSNTGWAYGGQNPTTKWLVFLGSIVVGFSAVAAAVQLIRLSLAGFEAARGRDEGAKT